MSPAPRFFVAGSTGYTGRALLPHALAAGASVVAHIRPASSRLADCGPAFQDLGASLSTAPWQRDAIAAALVEAAPTAVFALLGTSGPRRKEARAAGRRDDYTSVDLELTQMLMQAAAALPTPPRFVYLSALGADRPAGAYMQVRATIERELRSGPLPFTIARPAFITGEDRPDARPGERIGAIVTDGLLGALAAVGVSGLRDRFASLTGDTLARALVAAALDPEQEGATLEPPDLRRLAGA
jgi:nucleoside-diphosphate-sugar epimerase